jgi:hypothetical protein
MKKALIIGIDDYPSNPLGGCVNDASAAANTLERNGDGSPNFSVKLLTSNNLNVSTKVIHNSLIELFKGEADIALLFFAGHGIINNETNEGYIVSQDGTNPSWGITLATILSLANNASPKIKSTVIILDCCHSGYAGELPGLNSDGKISHIGNGVTILTGCHREELASEENSQGLFTGIFLDGLSGSASDICGRVTPASLYSLIDQTLGAWEQRPIYKANVQTFITLRNVTPKIPLEILRRLPKYFPQASYCFPLDPSFEPDRNNIPKELRKNPINEENTKIFKELQMCNRHGLVVPVDVDHMYDAAINSKACKLTALGAHYRKLAELKRI